MKYTKGKWTTKSDKFGDIMIALDDEKLHCSGYPYDSNLICETILAPNNDEIDSNIRLIVSSPVMYETLRDVANKIAKKGIDLSNRDKEILDDIRKCIKNVENFEI